ncbi:diaminopimelate epimerase [Priestia aryabhattai]|uniref:diaminopimelate epimerase n=1 Tax=Priestia aryabhattai TaxID=412384 RepID=UPI000BF8E27B|nr:diaminopimelate epimerase [Priestia aryabhattai]PGA19467.1 diaminopimelate epimerase [Priestia aryabhattai]
MKRHVKFIKFSPTQNMTILVDGQHLKEDYQKIALRLMAYDHVYAEQVGFIEKPKQSNADGNLRMAGNEFCGNACMSLAVFIAHQKGLRENNESHLLIETSGTDDLIRCRVKKVANNYRCRISMPLPKKIEPRNIEYKNTYLEAYNVQYEDFFHLVLKVKRINAEIKETAENIAQSMGKIYPDILIGILLYEEESHYLAPLIYIPKLNSMVWERGCGSGTASIGACLAFLRKGKVSVRIKQPGGSIHVFGEHENKTLKSLQIEGTVNIVAQGEAFITL